MPFEKGPRGPQQLFQTERGKLDLLDTTLAEQRILLKEIH